MKSYTIKAAGSIHNTVDVYRDQLKDLLHIHCWQEIRHAEELANDVIKRWQEPHRVFHTLDHLDYIIKSIENITEVMSFTEEQVAILILAAFYHDVIYDPKKSDNEKKSAFYFDETTGFLHTEITSNVTKIIHESNINDETTTELSRIFRKFDIGSIYDATIEQLVEYENQIFKEYQHVPYAQYVEGRIAVLNKLILIRPTDNHYIHELIDFIKCRKVRVVVYPGSFNPFHKGHLAILKQAEEIFDKVIIAVGHNPNKADATKQALESLNNMQATRYNEVVYIKGLLTDFISDYESEHCDVTVVKGLRNGADLDYEINQGRFMTDMKSDYKVVYLPCDIDYSHVSSTAIRQLLILDPKTAHKYLPK